MNEQGLGVRLRDRLGVLGISASADVVTGCASYLRLLHKWNQRVNLTGFDLSQPSETAIDRLIAEPLAAARLIEPTETKVVDIGTGSGSPAIGLKLARPDLRMIWFEARSKKAAFLREAVRVLGLSDVQVIAERFGDPRTREWVPGDVDVVTIRGVRVDRLLMRAIRGLTAGSLRVLLFAGEQPIHPVIGGLLRSEQLWVHGPLLSVATISQFDASQS